MSTGKRVGMIVDVIVDTTGSIKSLILEERRGRKFSSREEYELDWKQYTKCVRIDKQFRKKYDEKYWKWSFEYQDAANKEGVSTFYTRSICFNEVLKN